MLHGDLLGERARLTPDKLALVYVPTGERLTYRQLYERAARAAAAWHGLDLAKGDRIGLLAGNRIEFLDCFFAAGKSGVILVPLSTRATAHELAHIVRDSGMRALIFDSAFAPMVSELRSQVSLEHWIALDAPASPSDRDWCDLASRAPRPEPRAPISPSDRDWCDLASRAPRPEPRAPISPSDRAWCDLVSRAPSPAPRAPLHPEDTYCLLYTSGTTGKPKGVIVPHRMVSWNAVNTVCCWQLREDDVSPIFTPLYHAGALGAFLTPIIAIGGTIVLHASFDPAEVWRTITAERCTVVLGVPTIYKLLMEAPEFASVDLSHVRWLISGGAPLPLYIIEAYQRRGVVFRQGYGLTEVGVNCFAMTNEDSVRKAGAIGKPLLFTEARVANDAGAEAPAGEVGELWLRGPHVSSGYWNNPTATAAAYDADGWFHTGDLARRDEEGFYTIAGRAKDMIISGGVNIYPAEIEGELLLHPDIRDAAVVGVPHDTWGEVGVAFVVRREGATTAGEDLAAFLLLKLAKYKVPREFVFVDALPRTPYGKVLKGELRSAWERGSGSGARGSEDGTPESSPDPSPEPRKVVGESVSTGKQAQPRILTHRVEGATSGATVLLLNGGMMSISAWDEAAAALAPRYRVVRCDFRGQLLTPELPPPELAAHVADVVALLDHLALERVHVVGTSFGGEVGLLLAVRHGERVASLVAATVVDVPPPSMKAIGKRLIELCEEAMATGDGRPFLAAMNEIVYSPPFRARVAADLAARAAASGSLPATWFSGGARLLQAIDRMDLRAELGRIACPTLVITAERDELMPAERSLAAAKAVPGAEHVVVAGSGHALVVEEKQRFLALVTEFLSRQSKPGRDVLRSP